MRDRAGSRTKRNKRGMAAARLSTAAARRATLTT